MSHYTNFSQSILFYFREVFPGFVPLQTTSNILSNLTCISIMAYIMNTMPLARRRQEANCSLTLFQTRCKENYHQYICSGGFENLPFTEHSGCLLFTRGNRLVHGLCKPHPPPPMENSVGDMRSCVFLLRNSL